MTCYDDAVIGAGILGLAHAYQLARRGRRVSCSSAIRPPRGASVRNFGMLWPIGQPAGELRDLARRSLTHWLEVLAAAGLWHRRTGSLHLAYREDEARVLRGVPRSRVDRGESRRAARSGGVRRPGSPRPTRGLIGALWSPEEVCVDPREVIAGLPDWLWRASRRRVSLRRPGRRRPARLPHRRRQRPSRGGSRSGSARATSSASSSPSCSRERAGPLQAPDDAVAAPAVRMVDSARCSPAG